MSASNRFFVIVGCLFLATAGALSAYGFHGLAAEIPPAKREAWEWAVQMQFYHGIGLVLVGTLGAQFARAWAALIAGLLMIAGIVIFSVLIYAEVLGAPEAIGEIVPMGGMGLMLSWLVLGAGVLLRR